MNKTTIISMGIVLILLIAITGCIKTEEESEKEMIVSKVNEAVTLIETKGESCFAEFRKENSTWFHDDFYIFVWKTNGIRIVYPPNISGEGQNMSTLVDYNEKPIGAMFIDIALSEVGEGWIFYEWPKPGESAPSEKYTFIKRAETANETYLVGSGYYEEEDKELASKKEDIASKVNESVALIKEQGEACFDDFRQENSTWFHGNFYVWVWDINGTRLVYPPNTSREGKNGIDEVDYVGKPLGRLIMDIALSEVGEGWLIYQWPKPEEWTKSEPTPSEKYTFIKRAETANETYIIGSGFYA